MRQVLHWFAAETRGEGGDETQNTLCCVLFLYHVLAGRDSVTRRACEVVPDLGDILSVFSWLRWIILHVLCRFFFIFLGYLFFLFTCKETVNLALYISFSYG